MLAESFYTIHYPKYRLLRDESKEKYSRAPFARKELLFHIEKGDYFGTLATVLNLIKDSISAENASPQRREWEIRSLSRSAEDLMYLQERHTIGLKDKEKRRI